jgi:hypothetical protein
MYTGKVEIPDGYTETKNPKKATHVLDFNNSIVDLSKPGARYSRSLRAWLIKDAAECIRGLAPNGGEVSGGVITRDHVLAASHEQLRRWCGLLEYGEVRESLPRYTESLDAILPLQERALRQFDANTLRLLRVYGWHLEVAQHTTAEQRARAVCLTLLGELNALLEENDRG